MTTQRNRPVKRNGIDYHLPKTRESKSCIFPGCDRPNAAHGLCATHATQKRRGVTLRPIRPPRPKPKSGYRWCGTCHQYIDETQFGWDTTRGEPKRTCDACHAASAKKYNDTNRERVRLTNRCRQRGITIEEYERLVRKQRGQCPICLRTDRPLDIDHCHKTGRVRALLCGPCNRALGFMDDDPDIARRAVRFLVKHKG